MRWHIFLWKQLEKIVLKIFGSLVVLLHSMCFWMFLKTALKKVERRVISPIENILNVLL
jgi:hypothetical protein